MRQGSADCSAAVQFVDRQSPLYYYISDKTRFRQDSDVISFMNLWLCDSYVYCMQLLGVKLLASPIFAAVALFLWTERDYVTFRSFCYRKSICRL